MPPKTRKSIKNPGIQLHILANWGFSLKHHVLAHACAHTKCAGSKSHYMYLQALNESYTKLCHVRNELRLVNIFRLWNFRNVPLLKSGCSGHVAVHRHNHMNQGQVSMLENVFCPGERVSTNMNKVVATFTPI